MKKNFTVVAFKPCKYDFNCKVAIIDRHFEFCPFVVAWGFNADTMTWDQGHYFESYEDAKNYFDNNY